MELIIGNKNYSSWSLRGWLVLNAFDIPFEETLLPLFNAAFYAELERRGVPGKVPVLLDGDIKVWDSLAICEYVSETYLDGRGWPVDKSARAEARSVANEMHSGFVAVRSEMPMNCRARKQLTLSEDALKEVARIDAIWSGLYERFSEQGPWLFGEFSLADVMFAPVVLRFVTYGVDVSAQSRRYMETMLSHPSIQCWMEDAEKESTVIAESEVGLAI